MDPQLLQYYNEELVYMRQMAGEFAHLHPKIARRLGMHEIEVADPYVERLIEAFCFMSARTRIKLDAEFPRFTQRLLEVIYPNYVCPTPSIAVAQIHPNLKEGDLSKGIFVPRDSAFYAKIPEGENTACEFRSSKDVQLWPIAIDSAKIAGVPPDIPTLERYLPPHVRIAGSLRLKLRCNDQIKFSELKGINELSVYLCGDEQVASFLFELLHTSAVASFIGVPGKMGQHTHVIVQNALTHVGMKPGEGLLPLAWNTLHGHNLLHEYFACPSRFYFFALNDLAPGLSKIEHNEAEIVIVLNQQNENFSKLLDKLSGLVDAGQFALHCTPIINLFPRRTDRIEINYKQSEFHLVVDRSRPMDFEIFSVTELAGQEATTTAPVIFRPLYQTLNQDEGNHGRYFSIRRETRLASDSARKYGTRTPYVGSEVFLSLVDQHEAPYADSLRYLSVQSWQTNRDLPRLVPRNGVSDLSIAGSTPIKSIGLIRPTSPPKAAFAERELAWRLIRQLSFNYIPLDNLSHREGAQALRDMLKLFIQGDDEVMSRQIQNIIGTRTKPVTRRLPGVGPLIYGRGVECEITVDEDGFSGTSPYLFGLILEHYFARHVSINTFCETHLKSMQRGEIAHWPVRMGTRGAV